MKRKAIDPDLVAKADSLKDKYTLHAKLDQWQSAAFTDIFSGVSLFLTGAAGNGKSHLIRIVADVLREEEAHYAITSTTGIAAVQISGETLARFTHTGVMDGTGAQIWSRMRVKTKEMRALRFKLKTLQLLVIDEVSMLSAEMFEAVSYILSQLRDNTAPFGGVQVILCGDFSQLSPVKGDYAFKAPLWKSMQLVIHELRGNHRQDHDIQYQRILNSVRRGEITPDVCAMLQARVNAPLQLAAGVQPAELTTRRLDAQTINEARIALLPPDPEYTYTATVHVETLDDSVDEAQKKALADSMKNDMITPPEYKLRIGTQVMLTANLDVGSGLANGSMGYVTGFRKTQKLKLKQVEKDAEEGDGSEGPVELESESESEGLDVYVPFVTFSNGLKMTIQEHTWVNDNNKCGSTVHYRQVPLLPAFAITIHKSQGSTLDAVKLSLTGRVVGNGAAYVALSRVRNVNSLLLTAFHPSAIKTSPDVISFYKEHGLAGFERKQHAPSSN